MVQKLTYELTLQEVLLLDEALRKAAGRHETESRYNPRVAAPHDKKANAMHKLRVRLLGPVNGELTK